MESSFYIIKIFNYNNTFNFVSKKDYYNILSGTSVRIIKLIGYIKPYMY